MNTTQDSGTPSPARPNQSLGWFPYVVSILSFIPLLGVPIGLVCVVFGVIKRKSNGLVVSGIGLAGIVLSVVLYGNLALQLKHPTGDYAQLQTELLADRVLLDMVKAVEFYKLENSHYPNQLEELGDDVKAQISLQGMSSGLGEIFYELTPEGDTYYLLVTGPDGKPFTNDDIHPNISSQEMQKIGYRSKI